MTAEAPARRELQDYMGGEAIRPLFMLGETLEVLSRLPSESIDCCMTSPPYWGQRQYATEAIGLERDHKDYVFRLAAIFLELKRTLKSTGSLWLNLGDAYLNKRLLGLPWRVAFELIDNQGWILRNDVIWNKIKGGPDNSLDKLRNVHEYVFHFVKSPIGYHYHADAIRSTPQTSRVVNGAIVSATGVSGVRYKRQIELSTVLTEQEKENAFRALDDLLGEMQQGKLSD